MNNAHWIVSFAVAVGAYGCSPSAPHQCSLDHPLRRAFASSAVGKDPSLYLPLASSVFSSFFRIFDSVLILIEENMWDKLTFKSMPTQFRAPIVLCWKWTQASRRRRFSLSLLSADANHLQANETHSLSCTNLLPQCLPFSPLHW